VRNIVAGLPVAANLVTAVFEAIAGKKALNEHEHIFN
jgi:hypothetical protein